MKLGLDRFLQEHAETGSEQLIPPMLTWYVSGSGCDGGKLSLALAAMAASSSSVMSMAFRKLPVSPVCSTLESLGCRYGAAAFAISSRLVDFCCFIPHLRWLYIWRGHELTQSAFLKESRQ